MGKSKSVPKFSALRSAPPPLWYSQHIPMTAEKNKLYYGDNLDVLKLYLKDESVDLVYLDPPFNSRQDYNVLFAEKDGSQSSSQIHAFEDTWEWNIEAERTLEEIIEKGGRVADALRSFRTFLGGSDMMAYLAMMAPRLVELRRVLKETGSIYLHCDPTASHYLKILMDAVFGPQFFQNEITWKRTTAHNDPERYGRNTDIILFYSKSKVKTWNSVYSVHDDVYLTRFRNEDQNGRRWADFDLSGAGQGPSRNFGPKGELDPPSGRHWMYNQEGIDSLLKANKIHWTKTGRPRLKLYVDETSGVPVQALWDDI
ncbi:MAG: DNA methyltransferase, partial [Terracidiphilus sp.]